MIHKDNKVHFEWTVSLGNLLSLLGIITTVAGAMFYVAKIEARVDQVDLRVSSAETINGIRRQSRDQQLEQIDLRLKIVEGDVKTILSVVTRNPRDEQN